MNKLLIGCVSALAGLASLAGADQPFSTWMTDSMIAHGITATRSYAVAVFYLGAIMVFEKTGNSTYESYVQNATDTAIVNSTGVIQDWDFTVDSLDDILVGRVLLHLYRETGEAKYKTAADFLRQRLNVQPRNPAGGFWHRWPVYPNQMWLDGIFMAEPFYAEYTAMFEPTNITAWDDILLQFDLVQEHCLNATTHLLVHGYDASKVAVWANPITGASPHVWDRALGWYTMALLDVLDYFPESHPGHAKLLGYFTSLAAALKKVQDASGGWWLVMDQPFPGMPGNYIESSGTAMFTYGWLKGIRKGYISANEYLAPARTAYNTMTERFVAHNGTGGTLNWEGTVIVGSLSGNASYQYYISQPVDENDLKGAGPFVYASIELENLNA